MRSSLRVRTWFAVRERAVPGRKLAGHRLLRHMPAISTAQLRSKSANGFLPMADAGSAATGLVGAPKHAQYRQTSAAAAASILRFAGCSAEGMAVLK